MSQNVARTINCESTFIGRLTCAELRCVDLKARLARTIIVVDEVGALSKVLAGEGCAFVDFCKKLICNQRA